jgi:hypothetical protein
MVQNVARTLHLSPTSVYLLSVSVSLVLAIVLGCGLVQKESRTPASCGAGGVLCANPFALLAAFIILENLGIHLTVIWNTWVWAAWL